MDQGRYLTGADPRARNASEHVYSDVAPSAREGRAVKNQKFGGYSELDTENVGIDVFQKSALLAAYISERVSFNRFAVPWFITAL
ncbi:unnamed protein product, partial [Nesidiocoris tenuis]